MVNYMNDIENIFNELVNSIRENDKFKKYKILKNKLEKDKEINKLINEIKLKIVIKFIHSNF